MKFCALLVYLVTIASLNLPPPTSRTYKILSRSAPSKGSAAGSLTDLPSFQRLENIWDQVKHDSLPPPPKFIFSTPPPTHSTSTAAPTDVIVAGGTLGIIQAVALLLSGHGVTTIEAAPRIAGREQEWNISEHELEAVKRIAERACQELNKTMDWGSVIGTKFDGCRAGFKNSETEQPLLDTPETNNYFASGGYEVFVPSVLNIGVKPDALLTMFRELFVELGGKLLEGTKISAIHSPPEGLVSVVTGGNEVLSARLLLDCTGNASPLTRDLRRNERPDGICVVVGTCAGGFDPGKNKDGDIIYTNTPITDVGGSQTQYFWEAFPVSTSNGPEVADSDVKTTYMFTYLDASENRPSLTDYFEDYWRLLPIYQKGVDIDKLDIKRTLFAFFPTYRNSPLQVPYARVISLFDASGIQSPLSFGGFGALTRHIDRTTRAIDLALVAGDSVLADPTALNKINSYLPNLSASWMMQTAMSTRPNKKVDRKFVNRLLGVNFEIQKRLGDDVLMPFMQDVIQPGGLARSLFGSFLADPLFTPAIISHVGIPTLAEWAGHVVMMNYYNLCHKYFRGEKPSGSSSARDRFMWQVTRDAWEYGSGNDYKLKKL